MVKRLSLLIALVIVAGCNQTAPKIDWDARAASAVAQGNALLGPMGGPFSPIIEAPAKVDAPAPVVVYDSPAPARVFYFTCTNCGATGTCYASKPPMRVHCPKCYTLAMTLDDPQPEEKPDATASDPTTR